LRTGFRPEHARLFESLADDGLAAARSDGVRPVHGAFEAIDWNATNAHFAGILSCRFLNWAFVSLSRAAKFGLVPRMPRRLRVQYEDALDHVINRGNYRLPVFTSVGRLHSALA
jgi:hypothetical protein